MQNITRGQFDPLPFGGQKTHLDRVKSQNTNFDPNGGHLRFGCFGICCYGRMQIIALQVLHSLPMKTWV